MARNPKVIDWDLVELMMEAGANQTQIAMAFNVHRDTLRDSFKKEYGIDFSTYSTTKLQYGDAVLLAAQYQKALKSSSPGNTQMLIYLGKVRLGQKEAQENVPSNSKELKDILDHLNKKDEKNASE